MKLSELLRREAASLSKWGHPGAVSLMQDAAKELDRREKRIKRLTDESHNPLRQPPK